VDVTIATRLLRAAAIAGIGLLWGALLAALGLVTLGGIVVLVGLGVAVVALVLPAREQLSRLEGSAEAVAGAIASSAAVAGRRTLRAADRVARAAARQVVGLGVFMAAVGEALAVTARHTSRNWNSAARVRAPLLKAQIRELERRVVQSLPERGSPSQLLVRSTKLRRGGQNAEAVNAAARAAESSRAEGDPHGEALALNTLALALAADARYAEAVEKLDRAVELLAQTDKRHDEGRVLANLGVVHRKAGGAEDAKRCLAQALERLDSNSRESVQAAELLRAS
jgi:tetratricopeptide (TPR) repeat protein